MVFAENWTHYLPYTKTIYYVLPKSRSFTFLFTVLEIYKIV